MQIKWPAFAEAQPSRRERHALGSDGAAQQGDAPDGPLRGPQVIADPLCRRFLIRGERTRKLAVIFGVVGLG